jgi:glycosyltransferase involved in cell wall biosynthesis
MRVSLYYPWIYLTSGAERTILQLVRHSRHDWSIFTNHYDPAHTFPEFQEHSVVQLKPVSVRRSVSAVAKAALRIATQRLPLSGHSALVTVCEGLGDLVVLRNTRLPILCICLTPLRPVFDAEYRARAMQVRNAFGRHVLGVASSVFRQIDRFAWQHYRRVFCISREVEARILEGGLAEPDRLEVLHPGIGFDALAAQGTFDLYFLISGRIMWTKNIELGIRAFRQFLLSNPAHSNFRLVIAGIVDAKSRAYHDQLREIASGCPNIQFRIFPSDDELAELYRHCYALVFTSFNEDWGMVPLEAMAFGKPVIAVNRGGPRETVVPGVSGFLEAEEPKALSARMAELVANPELARQMGQQGRRLAQRFGWDRFARRIDDELDYIVGSSKTPADASHPLLTPRQRIPGSAA